MIWPNKSFYRRHLLFDLWTVCIYCFRYAITEFLLENKINKHAVSHSGITPMAIAVEHLNPAMVRILIKYGYNMNKVCTFIMCFVLVFVWDNKSQQHHLPSFGFDEPDLFIFMFWDSRALDSYTKSVWVFVTHAFLLAITGCRNIYRYFVVPAIGNQMSKSCVII